MTQMTESREPSNRPETGMRYSQSVIRHARRGSVLVYVVWVLMLLSLFATSVGSQGLFAVDLSDRFSEQLKAAYIARGAVQYAALVLEHDPSPTVDALNEEWSNNPDQFLDHPLGEGIFRLRAEGPFQSGSWYGLMDEERRVNLNTAPVQVLQRLLEGVGDLSEGEAIEIAESIADWRDEDDDRRSLGAENAYYQSWGYECKNEPFENVEELLLVKGVSPDVYEQLEGHVTVFGSGRVNLNTATETTLEALGLSEAAVDGILLYRIGEDNLGGTADDRRLVSVRGLESELGAFVPTEDLRHLEELAREKVLTVQSRDFRMAIEAQTNHPASRVNVVGVIDRQGTVAFWAER